MMVDVVFLPENMTGELQVLDLVVTGPLKAHIRSNRAKRLYRSFHEYKVERVVDSNLPRVQRKKLNFNPPKPTMNEGIQDLLRLFKEEMTEGNFLRLHTQNLHKKRAHFQYTRRTVANLPHS